MECVIYTHVWFAYRNLQVLLFNPGKPFTRGQAYMNQDIDLMIDCFVSCFRINPHNNEALKVCLNPNSPPTFHFVLVASLYRFVTTAHHTTIQYPDSWLHNLTLLLDEFSYHRIITQQLLSWWPHIDLMYNKSAELRAMFIDTLTKVTQGCISHTPLRMIQVIMALVFSLCSLFFILLALL